MSRSHVLSGRYISAFGNEPDVVARAPGRVNLIGEHTDYNEGFVLPVAISVETQVAVRRRDDERVRVIAADLADAEANWSMRDAPPPPGSGDWSAHVHGMLSALQADGLAIPGIDMMITGTVPQGAGLSSSASLAVAIGTAVSALAGSKPDPVKIAKLAQRSEIEVVGTNCGIMDQLVSACGVSGHALLIDCRTLALRAVPLPADMAIMIVHSGITRGLVEGAYNECRAACEAVARTMGVAALRDVDEAMLDHHAARIDAVAFARARHVVTENARTLAAADALANGDLVTLGQLMAQSHASMRDNFEITLPAIDALVALLQSAIGNNGGARMTGGGFGGAVVALMPMACVDAVRSAVEAGYQTPEGKAPMILIERACDGAGLLA